MKPFIVVAAAGVLAACSSSNPTVSFSARAGAQSGASLQASTQVITSGAVTIDHVQMVVQSVELERPDANGGTNPVDEELGAGPFLIEFATNELDGHLKHVFDGSVPAGTYDKMKFKIHHVEDAEAAANAALAPLKGKSIVITGTYAAAPFTFTSSLEEEQEREGTFTVADGSNNITLNIDPSGWFVGSGGATLDPTLSANRSQIESNIKASIDAYDDDDRDGVDD